MPAGTVHSRSTEGHSSSAAGKALSAAQMRLAFPEGRNDTNVVYPVFCWARSITKTEVASYNSKVRSGASDKTAMVLVEMDQELDLDNLLADVRQHKPDLRYFFVLDDTSAAKGALRTIEVARVVHDSDSNRYWETFPDAAETRTFYVEPETAWAVAVNLRIAKLAWDELERDDPNHIVSFDWCKH